MLRTPRAHALGRELGAGARAGSALAGGEARNETEAQMTPADFGRTPRTERGTQ